jgi:hypothetical protein
VSYFDFSTYTAESGNLYVQKYNKKCANKINFRVKLRGRVIKAVVKTGFLTKNEVCDKSGLF